MAKKGIPLRFTGKRVYLQDYDLSQAILQGTSFTNMKLLSPVDKKIHLVGFELTTWYPYQGPSPSATHFDIYYCFCDEGRIEKWGIKRVSIIGLAFSRIVPFSACIVLFSISRVFFVLFLYYFIIKCRVAPSCF